MSYSCAVLQLPGTNCEYETAYACERVGFDVDVLRWNCDSTQFNGYDAYIVPGGFSFQDRVRAGAISSKLPIMQNLVEQARAKKPVLGICNGCQILAELGLIPDLFENQKLEVALSPNAKQKNPLGFMCEWVFVKVVNPQATAFTRRFLAGDVLPIPINHGEGRFVLGEEVLARLSELTLFVYCDEAGVVRSHYPVNPNGSAQNIAGMCNKAGNVLGLMPHPERSSELKQIPFWIESCWADKKDEAFHSLSSDDGPWANMFLSMADYIKEQKAIVVS